MVKWIGAGVPGSPLFVPVFGGGIPAVPFTRDNVISEASAAGRTSTETLKVPGVDTLPAGASWNGTTVTVTGDDVFLSDWKINRIAGSGLRCILSQCEIEDVGTGGADYPVANTGANWTLQHCDLYGDGDPYGSSAIIVSGADNFTLRLCHIRDYSDDGIKLSGPGALIELNRFGQPNNFVGVPDYDAETYYAPGEVVRSGGNTWEKDSTAAAGTTPATGGDWTDLDPHVDQISIFGGSGVIRYNVFDDPVDDFDGATQQIRIVRNTGTSVEIGDWKVYGNVLRGWPGAYPLIGGVIRPFVARTYAIGELAASSNGRVFYRATASTTTNPGTDPTDWVEDRDLNVTGQILFAHNWIEAGTSGLYNDGSSSIAPVATASNSNAADEDVLEFDAQPVISAPANVGAALPYSPPTQYGPAQVFTIEPTAFTGTAELVGVDYPDVVAIRVGIQIAALIDSTGKWYVGAYKGVSMEANGDGTYTLRIYDSSGSPMDGTVSICAGAASVTAEADEATTGPAWGTEPAETISSDTEYAISASDFSKDYVVFDSGAQQGASAASIPVSGTTDAPDGTVFQWAADDVENAGAESVGWTDFTPTITAGDWSGTISLPRTAAWMRLKFRVKNQTAEVQNTNRVNAGHIWAVWSQSMIHRCTRHENDESAVLPAPTITDVNAVQVVRPLNGDATNDDRVAEFVRVGTGSYSGGTSYGSTAIAAFAQEFIETRPGEKLLCIFQVLQGSDPRDLGNDSNPERSFDIDKSLHDLAITEAGQKVGLVTHPWFASPAGLRSDYASLVAAFFFGRNSTDGTAIAELASTSAASPAGYLLTMASGNNTATIDRTALELYDWTYAKMANLGQFGAGPDEDENNLPDYLADIRPAMAAMAGGTLSDVYVSPYGIELYNISKYGLPDVEPKGDGGHPAAATEYGRHQLMRLLVHGMLQQAGLTTWEVPVYNRSSWASDGSYVELWFEDSGANTPAFTTTRIASGTAPIADFDLEVSNGAFITGVKADRSAIVGGKIRIYPDALNRTFTQIDTVTPMTGGGITYATVTGSETWMNCPIMDIGSANLAGVPMCGVFDPADLLTGRDALPLPPNLYDFPFGDETIGNLGNVGTFTDLGDGTYQIRRVGNRVSYVYWDISELVDPPALTNGQSYVFTGEWQAEAAVEAMVDFVASARRTYEGTTFTGLGAQQIDRWDLLEGEASAWSEFSVQFEQGANSFVGFYIPTRGTDTSRQILRLRNLAIRVV